MHLTVQRDSENDLLYLAVTKRAFRKGAVARTSRVDDDIVIDFGPDGSLLGIEIMNASTRLGRRWKELDVDELVGVKEAAAIVGVRAPNLLRDHAAHREFPKPVAELASGRIWSRSDIEGYARSRVKRRALKAS